MATIAQPSVFPDHVPPELRWDRSLGQFAHEGEDPFVAVSRLHDGPEIVYSPDVSHENPGWILTRHDLIQEAFIDYGHFTSEGGSGTGAVIGDGFHLIPIDTDPPDQVAYRKIINPFFTPKAVKALEDAVTDTCEMLISKFEDKGGCEFIEDFAVPFPSYIFLSLMGMPLDEAPKFLAWEAGMLRGETSEARGAAMMGVLGYLKQFIIDQRANPTSPMIEQILQAEFKGEPLTDMQLLGIFFTFYAGGLDTVYSTLGWTLRHLALRPELQSRLRENPDLIDHAVDEFARCYSVVSTKRVVKQDFTFHGVDMRKGDIVLLPLFLAGRDPKAWENPAEIDLDRRPASLAFGSGPHLCAGRQLARREMRVALKSILSRFDNIRIAPGETYTYHTSPVFGIDSLPLVWDRI